MREWGSSIGRWLRNRQEKLPGLIALLIIAALEATLSTQLTLNALLARNFDFTLSAAWSEEQVTQFFITGVFLVALGGWLFDLDRVTRVGLLVFTSYMSGLITLSVAALVGTLAYREGTVGGFFLLYDAGIVWITNWLVGALWYWLIDGGGADRRAVQPPPRPDLLFPQQQTPTHGWEGWQPGFLDYVFVAFSASVGFTPADTVALSRRVKVLMMIQAANSLVVLGMIAARAVNIIQ
jgi:hypothetical protein